MTAEWVRVDLDAVEKYGADAAVVLGLIAYRCNLTGEWAASLTDLTTEARLTEHRVRTALRVLRDAGAVHSRRADRFHPTLTWSVSAGHAVNADSSITRISNPPSPEMGNSSITSYTEVEEPLVVPQTPPPLRATGPSAAVLDAEFDRFWSLYPRRVGKKAARTAYGRARRTATVEQIARALRSQLPDLQAKELQYVPHPSTWLNQGRWEDDLLQEPEAPLPPQRPHGWVAGW